MVSKLSIKSSNTTRYASIGLLVVYVLYALTAIGMTGLLFSAAVGLLTYGVLESVEITAIITILSGILYKVSMGRKEGFTGTGTGSKKEAFQTMDPSEVVNNIKKMKAGGPTGVLASSFAEGFADASGTGNAGGTVADSSIPAVPAVPAMPGLPSLPEGTGMPSLPSMPSMPSMPVGTGAAASVPAEANIDDLTKTLMASMKAPGATPPEKFKNDNKGLFKLGEIPTDEAGGFHIDQGTTVLNALNALKPDQLKGMSEDTQKLIDTQKSLMGMLGTMKPMLQDGRQLLDTFNSMFNQN